jgi:Polyketide cyclase / dehydrase and lipid transport
MTEVVDTIEVTQGRDEVWASIRDPQVHAGWHPLLRSIQGDHALGATRTCIVDMGGKEARAVERCTTYVEGREIGWTVEEDSTGFTRMVSDWSSGFRLENGPEGRTRVTAWSRFTPRTLAARLMVPVIRMKFHGVQRKILGALEAETRSTA